MEQIINKVSEYINMPVSVIMSRSRKRDVIDARRIFIYLSYTSGISSAKISREIGMTQRCVMWNVETLIGQMKLYKSINRDVNEIKNAII